MAAWMAMGMPQWPTQQQNQKIFSASIMRKVTRHALLCTHTKVSAEQLGFLVLLEAIYDDVMFECESLTYPHDMARQDKLTMTRNAQGTLNFTVEVMTSLT